MAGPHTHREALMAELIGDVQSLLDRVGEMRAGLLATVEVAAEKLRKTVDESTAAVNESGVALSRSLDRQTKDAMKSMLETAREASRAAAVVKGAAGRLVALLVVLALLAGGAAGTLAVLVLRHVG